MFCQPGILSPYDSIYHCVFYLIMTLLNWIFHLWIFVTLYLCWTLQVYTKCPKFLPQCFYHISGYLQYHKLKNQNMMIQLYSVSYCRILSMTCWNRSISQSGTSCLTSYLHGSYLHILKLLQVHPMVLTTSSDEHLLYLVKTLPILQIPFAFLEYLIICGYKIWIKFYPSWILC